MAGSIIADNIQIGDHATAGNNFVLKTNADGTGKLMRGTVASPGATILSWDSSGNLTGTFTQATNPAFSAYMSAGQALNGIAYSKLNMDTEEFDYTNNYDTVNKRFTPNVAGLYLFTGAVQAQTAVSQIIPAIYKNGADHKRGAFDAASTNEVLGASMSILVPMNGTTDYVEMWCYFGAAANVLGGAGNAPVTYFQGCLIRKS